MVRSQFCYSKLGCRQAGKPSDFDSDIRRFESCHPIQFSFGKLDENRKSGSSHFGSTVLRFGSTRFVVEFCQKLSSLMRLAVEVCS
jgi:hypothetical protein